MAKLVNAPSSHLGGNGIAVPNLAGSTPVTDTSKNRGTSPTYLYSSSILKQTLDIEVLLMTSRYEDFSSSLLRQKDEFGEYFTVKATGHSGMSYSGLTRFVGKTYHKAVSRWVDRVRSATPGQNDLPECFKPFAGKRLTLGHYYDPEGREIVEDTFCAAVVKYFATEAPEKQKTEKAKQADNLIRQVGMRQLIHIRTGWKPNQESVEDEAFDAIFVRHKQRFDIRLALKDIFRVELMDAIKQWRERHRASRKVFWEAQDAANTRLQGLKSRQIKVDNGLPKSALIRDYYEAEPLIDYSAINRLAANLINGQDMHPVDAVNYACDLYLKPGFHPKLLPMVENVYKADRRLEASKKKRKQILGTQLSLLI